MKVLLFTDSGINIRTSGIGRAIRHQELALKINNIDYTTNQKDDYDILHMNFYDPKSFFFLKKAKKAGKKIVFHAHSTEEDFKNSFKFSNQLSPLFKKWIVKCYKYGDHIITPTPYSKSLLEGYGITIPITAISNGVDLSKFKYDKSSGDKFREELGFTKKDKVVMSVGLFFERKGILDFVELARRMPDYKFIWFGDIQSYLIPKKIKQAIKTKLDNLYFPGYIEPPILRTAYSGADLFIFPSYEETEGIVVLEALAMKQNVLIRDIPVYSEWLEDGKNVYKANDIDEFEQKIKDIISGDLKNLKKEGYKVVEDKTIEVMGQQLLEVYNKVSK